MDNNTREMLQDTVDSEDQIQSKKSNEDYKIIVLYNKGLFFMESRSKTI